jgi:histone deacetylase 11
VIEPSIIEFQPEFIIYNAGTDILAGDLLSHLTLSREVIIQRDYYVFGLAIKHKIPINMLLSGGYQMDNAVIISESIENIYKHFN